MSRHCPYAVGVLLGVLSAIAIAQPYPSRPVTIVVPFSAGTGIDLLARSFGMKLAERWGVGVTVDNRPGASANIGHEVVAQAPANGYTVLLTAATFVTNAAVNRSQRYDAEKSFAPVVLIATGLQSLVVPAGSPAKSVKELVQLAREQPGKLNYGSPGNGTPHHLVMELFKLEAGMDIVHVPYKGFVGALTDLMAARVDMMVMPVSAVAQYVQSGRLRVLAIMAPECSPVFPAVPTIAQEGYSRVEGSNWYALLVPAGTPAAIVARLNTDLNALLDDAAVGDALAKQGFSPVGGGPERLSTLVRAESERWRRIVEHAKIKAD